MVSAIKERASAIIWLAIFIVGWAALVVVSPLILLGYFHYQAWREWKQGERWVAVAIFLLACAAADISLGVAAVWLVTGEPPWSQF